MAIERLEELRVRAPESPWPARFLGTAYYFRGPTFRESSSFAYREAAEKFENLGEIEEAANAWISHSRVELFLGRPSLAPVERCQNMAPELSAVSVLRCRAEEARVRRALGEDAANVYMQLLAARDEILSSEEARFAFEQGESAAGKAVEEMLSLLAAVSQGIGRLEEAWKHRLDLLSLTIRRGHRWAEVEQLYNVARDYLEDGGAWPRDASALAALMPEREAAICGAARREPAGRRACARALLERSAQLAAEEGRVNFEALALIALASLDEEHRLGHLRRGLVLADEFGNLAIRAAARSALAAALVDDQPVEARALLDEAYAVASQAGGDEAAADGALSEVLAEAWESTFEVIWATREPRVAMAESRKLLRAVESFWTTSTEDRARAVAGWAEPFYWVFRKAMEGAESSTSGDESPALVEFAFESLERMRARVLLEALEAEAEQRALPPEIAELRKERATINRRLLDPSLEASAQVELEEELGLLERREASTLLKAGAATRGLLRDPELASVRDVQEALGNDEALLSFQTDSWSDAYGRPGGGSWLQVVTRNEVRLYPLRETDPLALSEDGTPELESRIELARESIDAGIDADEVLSSLYDLLLRQALDELPSAVRRLSIVPDGWLHVLPFSALLTSPGGPPLASRYILTEEPSATLWLSWRQQQGTGGEPALVFADPELGHAGQQAAERGYDLSPLPYARAEGKKVLRHLGGRSRLLAGEQATEHRLKSLDLAPYRILHFATHAVADERHPHRSAVFLSPDDEAEDGWLQPEEIASLDLSGKLVVLSACSSATGEVLRGEGIVSLARSFQEAGALAVVGSLWPLRDDEAASFFDDFYRFLATGVDVSTALAETQRQQVLAGKPSRAWAGIKVVGHGGLVPLPGGRPMPSRAWGLLVVALAALAAWLLRRQRQPA